MEAMLVHGIAEVRASEAVVARAFEERSETLGAKYALLQEQLNQIEVLFEAMNSAPLSDRALIAA